MIKASILSALFAILAGLCLSVAARSHIGNDSDVISKDSSVETEGTSNSTNERIYALQITYGTCVGRRPYTIRCGQDHISQRSGTSPSKGPLTLHALFPPSGRFCGAGNTQYSTRGSVCGYDLKNKKRCGNPIDELDRACFYHDLCHEVRSSTRQRQRPEPDSRDQYNLLPSGKFGVYCFKLPMR